MTTIRLLLADDQALVRGALAALLDLEADLQVVAEVGRGDEVLDAAREHRPDVALLDVEMPGLDGIAATEVLRAAMPEVRVLIVTTFGRPGYLRRALQCGAAGSWSRTPPPASWPTPCAGCTPACGWSTPRWPPTASSPASQPLTVRESEVLRSARDGAHRGRDRVRAVPVRGHGAQPPVRGDRQDRVAHPCRGGAGRRLQRVALSGDRRCDGRRPA